MGDSKAVLLVDDSGDDQFIAKYAMRKRWPDAEVICASDGVEAIRLLESRATHPPDLIILDINMPRMDGHEFLETWYHDHALDIPVVVVLTSSDQQSDKDRAGRFACVRDYVVKPIDASVLERLEPILGG